MPRPPDATPKAIPTYTNARITFAVTITFDRFQRSMYTPAGRLRMSHGNMALNVTALMSRASSVSMMASNGRAAAFIPSPRLETADAENCIQNWRGRRLRDSVIDRTVQRLHYEMPLNLP
jgi:hypothetical protein